jgi:hypothetical protein
VSLRDARVTDAGDEAAIPTLPSGVSPGRKSDWSGIAGGEGKRQDGVLDAIRNHFFKMMCCKFFLAIGMVGVVLLGGAGARAEGPHTPPVNSPERKAILDALRPPFERELKQPVKFDVSFFRVLGGWAFVLGAPENARSGKAIKAFPETDADFCGLLHQNDRGAWMVVDHAAGFGDPFYAEWPKKHGAPLAIFPEIVASMQKSASSTRTSACCQVSRVDPDFARHASPVRSARGRGLIRCWCCRRRAEGYSPRRLEDAKRERRRNDGGRRTEDGIAF